MVYIIVGFVFGICVGAVNAFKFVLILVVLDLTVAGLVFVAAMGAAVFLIRVDFIAFFTGVTEL